MSIRSIRMTIEYDQTSPIERIARCKASEFLHLYEDVYGETNEFGLRNQIEGFMKTVRKAFNMMRSPKYWGIQISFYYCTDYNPILLSLIELNDKAADSYDYYVYEEQESYVTEMSRKECIQAIEKLIADCIKKGETK